jgi:hypothetical protein
MNNIFVLKKLIDEKAVVYWFSILLLGCSSSDVPQISDQSYFPLRVGNFRIYQVNETDILRLACTDNGETVKNYQLKELVTDSSKNVEGSYTYSIHRYTRPDSTQSWVDLDTWTARINSNQVIVNQNNISVVKCIFPLVENSVWYVNRYNNLGKDYDTLKNFHKPFTLSNGNKIQNTFSAQRDTGELILHYDRAREVYAPSIGLIYKEHKHFEYFDNSNLPCFGHQVANSGVVYLQSLISYGHQ